MNTKPDHFIYPILTEHHTLLVEVATMEEYEIINC